VTLRDIEVRNVIDTLGKELSGSCLWRLNLDSVGDFVDENDKGTEAINCIEVKIIDVLRVADYGSWNSSWKLDRSD